MWSDAGCTYASIQYQNKASVVLSAGQYVAVSPGEYIHITLGDEQIDSKASDKIETMLAGSMPDVTGDEAHFLRRMRARKQLGADIMTAKVIQKINKEKQLLAEPTPIDIAACDADIEEELDDHMDTTGPGSNPEATSDNDGTTPQVPTDNTPKKTKNGDKTPQTTSNKITPPNK